jgi:Salmonella virulence plasmid 65kDa B protein
MTLASIESANGESPGGPIQPPTVSLPKGGGTIRGLGKKFAANPVTGSATFSILVPASPGRNGFGPQLALRYDSASGNGPFGFGWSLGLPTITRKTDKGLPGYRDDTDTFLISDAEDLVPVLSPTGEVDDGHESVPDYVIRRFRPRIEGIFARIERWTRDDGDMQWRSISTDNVLVASTCPGRVTDSDVTDGGSPGPAGKCPSSGAPPTDTPSSAGYS